MNNETIKRIFSVLLDTITKEGWTDSIMSWSFTAGDDDLILLTLSIYERYTIILGELTKLADSFEVSYKIEFRVDKGILEIYYWLTL